MSSSRESYESDQSDNELESSVSEESFAGSDELEEDSDEDLRRQITSPDITAEERILLSKTSRTGYYFLLEWLLQNLQLLNYSRNSPLLFFLEEAMGEKQVMDENEEGQRIAQTVLTNLPIQSAQQFINEQSFQRVIDAVHKSGYRNRAHESAVTASATCCGKHKLVHLFIKNNFPFDVPISKIKDKFDFCMRNKMKAKAECFLKTLEVVTEFELKNTLKAVKSKIQHFKFVIHNNGGCLIEGRDTKVPGHAANVFEIVTALLNANESLIDKFDEIVVKVKKELSTSHSDNANNDWFSLAWITDALPQLGGARDSTTDRCYDDMLEILEEGAQILNEYKQLHQQYADQWCDRDGIVLSAYPTMPQ